MVVVNLLRNSCTAYAPFELAAKSMLDELPETHPLLRRLAQRGLIVNFDELAAAELFTRASCAGARNSHGRGTCRATHHLEGRSLVEARDDPSTCERLNHGMVLPKPFDYR